MKFFIFSFLVKFEYVRKIISSKEFFYSQFKFFTIHFAPFLSIDLTRAQDGLE